MGWHIFHFKLMTETQGLSFTCLVLLVNSWLSIFIIADHNLDERDLSGHIISYQPDNVYFHLITAGSMKVTAERQQWNVYFWLQARHIEPGENFFCRPANAINDSLLLKTFWFVQAHFPRLILGLIAVLQSIRVEAKKIEFLAKNETDKIWRPK